MLVLQYIAMTLVITCLALLAWFCFSLIVSQRKLNDPTKRFKIPKEVKQEFESVKPGVYYPTEEEAFEYMQDLSEATRNSTANPYKAWGLYDADSDV
jgi:hypothetical protein